MQTTSKRARELNPRQAAFVDEYLIDANATQAAMRAGYSPKSAHHMGCYLLTRVPKVKRALTAARKRRSERTEVTADRVLLELARVGLADPRKLFTWSEQACAFVPSRDLTEDQAAAVASVKSVTTNFVDARGKITGYKVVVELKLWDKVAALREMGKHLGVAEHVDISFDQLSDLTDTQLSQRALMLAQRLKGRNNNGHGGGGKKRR